MQFEEAIIRMMKNHFFFRMTPCFLHLFLFLNHSIYVISCIHVFNVDIFCSSVNRTKNTKNKKKKKKKDSTRNSIEMICNSFGRVLEKKSIYVAHFVICLFLNRLAFDLFIFIQVLCIYDELTDSQVAQ